MAYTTPARVRLALAPGGNTDDKTAATLTDEDLLEQIAVGDAEIDAYLSSRYVVPVVDGETNTIISGWSTNIAAWYATLVYRKADDLEDADPVQRRRGAALAQLERVATGDIDLQIPVLTGAADAYMDYTGRLFDHTDWLPGNPGYHPEPYGTRSGWF